MPTESSVLTDHEMHHGLCHAYQVALDSKDPSTQNGAVIENDSFSSFVSEGECNIAISGVSDDFWKSPVKYLYVEHAERAVIYLAARRGYELDGATMYCPWAACPECARAIILSGITTLVVHKERMALTHDTWKRQVDLGLEMLRNAGVEIVEYSGVFGVKIRVDGKEVEL